MLGTVCLKVRNTDDLFCGESSDQLEEYSFIVEYNVSLKVINLPIVEAGYCRRNETSKKSSPLASLFYNIRCILSSIENSALEITAHDSVFTFAVHRYPIINSRETIALRSAYTSGSYSKCWLYCGTSLCGWRTCQGTVITSSGWTSCSKTRMFTITAKGKRDGEPINSGDTVSLRSNQYGSSYRLYCSSSYSSICRAQS